MKESRACSRLHDLHRPTIAVIIISSIIFRCQERRAEEGGVRDNHRRSTRKKRSRRRRRKRETEENEERRRRLPRSVRLCVTRVFSKNLALFDRRIVSQRQAGTVQGHPRINFRPSRGVFFLLLSASEARSCLRMEPAADCHHFLQEEMEPEALALER